MNQPTNEPTIGHITVVAFFAALIGGLIAAFAGFSQDTIVLYAISCALCATVFDWLAGRNNEYW